MEFEEYVEARGPALLRLAYVLTGDRDGAEDLVQAVLVDVLARWSRVAAADRPDAYVHRALVNRHLSWRRRRASSEVVLAGPPEPRTGGARDPAVGIGDRDEVVRALRTLPRRARTVLVLRYFADLDDQAIAAAMGIAPGTVRSTASRALAALRPHVVHPASATDGAQS